MSAVVCWSKSVVSQHLQVSTCSRMALMRPTSQSIRKRFSWRRSISSIMRRYSCGSVMLPTDLAVTCQLLATADSMMACRMENPKGAKIENTKHHAPLTETQQVFFFFTLEYCNSFCSYTNSRYNGKWSHWHSQCTSRMPGNAQFHSQTEAWHFSSGFRWTDIPLVLDECPVHFTDA